MIKIKCYYTCNFLYDYSVQHFLSRCHTKDTKTTNPTFYRMFFTVFKFDYCQRIQICNIFNVDFDFAFLVYFTHGCLLIINMFTHHFSISSVLVFGSIFKFREF